MSEPTNKQIGFAKKLGIKNPEKYSKEELSELIDKAKAEMKNKVVNTVREVTNQNQSVTVTSTRELPFESDIKSILHSYLKSYYKIIVLYDELYILSNLNNLHTESSLQVELIVNRITETFKQIEREIGNMVEYKLKLLDYKFGSNVEKLLTFFDNEINSRMFQTPDLKAFEQSNDDEDEEQVEGT